MRAHLIALFSAFQSKLRCSAGLAVAAAWIGVSGAFMVAPIVAPIVAGSSGPHMSLDLASEGSGARWEQLETALAPGRSSRLEGRFSKGDLALLAMSLKLSGRARGATWSEIFKLKWFSEADIEVASAIARNPERLSIREWQSQVKAAFNRVGVVIDESVLVRHWPLWIAGHMDAPDALDSRSLAMTRKLISAALFKGDGAYVGPLLDLHGPWILSDPVFGQSWRDRIVDSDVLITEMMSRLHLLPVFPAESQARLRELIYTRSPYLLAFYQRLVEAGTPADYMRRVPPGSSEKAEWVHFGVRSSLDHFFSLKPTIEDIRRLAQWMHNDDELFHLKERALRHTRDAGEFLRLTDFDYPEPRPEFYVNKVTRFLSSRVRLFLSLRPTAAQINLFRARLSSPALDFTIVTQASMETRSASEFLTLVGFSPKGTVSPGREQLRIRRYLMEYVDVFARLEPTVDEVNEFRRLVRMIEPEIRLLELVAPKITSAQDFLKLLNLYRDDRRAEADAYTQSMRIFAAQHMDMFLALRPSVAQINQYRQRLTGVSTDLAFVMEALSEPRSASEILELITYFGREPAQLPTSYRTRLQKVAESLLEKFLKADPSAEQIAEMRIWISNADADLRLVALGLRKSLKPAQALRFATRKPQRRTTETDFAWTRLLDASFKTFLALKPTPVDVDLYLRNVGDANVIVRLQNQVKAHVW
ncbi:MAG: hypothetical protein NDI61_00705 [Bdellovibrionaceae bacterium]|nr:hypothetical protein [Pseudobdellovibrionaceae bacterium]